MVVKVLTVREYCGDKVGDKADCSYHDESCTYCHGLCFLRICFACCRCCRPTLAIKIIVTTSKMLCCHISYDRSTDWLHCR